MITRKVMQAKDSFIITIPKHICQVLGIEKGDKMNVELEDHKIIFTNVHG